MSLKLFSLPVFIISFSIGVLIVYLMVYPTPENVGDLLYRDKAQSCFRFTPNETQCPKDETHIKKVGPQTK
jgi:hypothetical protein